MNTERLLLVLGVLVTLAGLGNVGLSLWLVSRDAEQARNIGANSERSGRLEAWREGEQDFREYVTRDLKDDLATASKDIAALRDLVGRACARP